jgi:hypothetical protein
VRLEKRIDDMPRPELTAVRMSDRNVSNPPTDAELDAAFGTPATVGAGFMVLITDAGGAAGPFWLVISNGTQWLYEGLTLAV